MAFGALKCQKVGVSFLISPPTSLLQCTLVIVNAWIVNNLSSVNIFGETGRFFYNINYMLNSEHISLVNKIGDKMEFTITRVHCISTCFHEFFEYESTNIFTYISRLEKKTNFFGTIFFLVQKGCFDRLENQNKYYVVCISLV